MRAGKLRHSIIIEKKTLTTDNMGGFTEVWSEHTITRASIYPMRGTEKVEFMKLGHTNVYNIWIRYFSGVLADMRIVFGSRYFEILSVLNPEEKNVDLFITAKELVT